MQNEVVRKMEIFLVRHGETEWNKQGLLLGDTNIPLNENGKEIAVRSAKGMKENGLSFDVVYSSPLSRTIETSRILVGEQEIQTDENLKELNFGDLEGVFCRNVADCPMPPPNGESLESLQTRMMRFLGNLLRKGYPEDSRILIVTHGTAIRSVVAAIRRLPIDRFWETIPYSNLGTCILSVRDGKLTIVAENVTYY